MIKQKKKKRNTHSIAWLICNKVIIIEKVKIFVGRKSHGGKKKEIEKDTTQVTSELSCLNAQKPRKPTTNYQTRKPQPIRGLIQGFRMGRQPFSNLNK